MQINPFWFVIPLRGKASSNDWEAVSRDVRRTLRSVLNQSDGRFRVLLSCAEVPDLANISDERLTILTGAYPVARTFMEKASDKRAKKRAAGAYLGERGGGYVMLLDADDYVSRDLVKHVLTSDNRSGYYFDEGYILYALTNTFEKIGSFFKKCGSCYVTYFEPEELPKNRTDENTAFEAYKNHRLARETAAEQGKMLERVPFPAAVYVLETGENLSTDHPNKRRWSRYKLLGIVRSIGRRLKGRRRIPAGLMDEFGIERALP